jgi:predicted dehydrogenase
MISKLKVAIVGCGKIADQHLLAIARIPDCEVVAVCDREILMARQLGERFGVAQIHSDAEEMLEAVSPDVVHITTPPQSHCALAKTCFEAGAHVYLEKPFTVTADEAVDLIEMAESRNVKITAGHNYQFTGEMMEMRRLVADGFLGGSPVHIESHWPYDLADASYAAALLGNKNHWVRKLPGQLFQNLLSHGIARMAEFLHEELTDIAVLSHQSPRLTKLGGEETQDELRVLIRDKSGTTAFLCFSTQIKPGLNFFRLCGPKNSITVDVSSGSLLRNEAKTCKSYLTYFLPPLRNARQHFKIGVANLLSFGRGRLYQDFGMKELIERFYNSIREETAPPIPYREILLTAKIMDQIFERTRPGGNLVQMPSNPQHEIRSYHLGEKRGNLYRQNA